MEKFGIENLKRLLLFFIDLAESLQSKLDDGKLTFGEKVDLLMSFIPVPGLVRDRVIIWNEINDLSESEINELVNFIGSEYETGNERAKELVNKSLEILKQVIQIAKILRNEN